MELRLIGEKKSDEAPALGPALRALLSKIWCSKPAFPDVRRFHAVTSLELPGLILQAEKESPDNPAIAEMRQEVAALVQKHGYFFIEEVSQ
jgi:hypothetical protein